MKFANAVVAGVAVLAVAGTVAIAAGTQKPPVHEITVALPGGGVEHIRYTGKVAPEVVLTDAPTFSHTWSAANPFYWPDPAFAELNRISADMDRFWASFDKRMVGLMNADQELLAQVNDPNKPLMASFGKLPAGSYSYVSQFSLNGACVKSTTITQRAGDAKPQVISKVSGDCEKGSSGAASAPESAPEAPTPISTRTTIHARPAQSL